MNRHQHTSTNSNDAVYYRFDLDAKQTSLSPSQWGSFKLALSCMVARLKKVFRKGKQ